MKKKLFYFIGICATLILIKPETALGYCNSGPSCGNAYISSVDLNGTTNSSGAGTYTLYSSPTFTITPLQLCTITISGSIAFAGNYHLNAWIDFDGSGDWNGVNSELISIPTVSYALGAFTKSTTFTVPATATVGNTRLRVQLRYVGPVFGAPNPCATGFCGEVEDYPVTIAPLPPLCSSASGNSSSVYISRTDVNGTTTFSGPSTSSSFLPGITLFPKTNYTLSVDITNPTATDESVYIYGWLEVNGDNVFSNNANEQIEVTPVAVNIPAFSTQSFSKVFFYNPPYATQASTLRVTASLASFGIPTPCATSFIGEVEDYSVVMHTDYCTDTSSYNFDYITNVTMNGVSTPSGPSYFSDFTNVVIPVFPGQTFPVSVSTAGAPTIASVYIDFNQNGYFQDPGEQINLAAGGGTFTGNIPVPANATVGNTRMRVVSIYTVGGGNALPCYLNGVSGEVEDYTVMIISPNPPTISCTSDIVVSQQPGQCYKQVLYSLPICTSNCNGGVIALVSGLASGSNFPIGTSPVTYSVTTPGGKASCTFFVTVNLNPLPVFSPAGTINICQGNSANLSISTSPTYLWNTGATAQSITTSTAGNYVVTVSDNLGCTQSFSQTVVVNPLPAAATGANQTLCLGSVVSIGYAAIPGNSYSWLPTTSLGTPNDAITTASPSSTTTYTLTEIVTATGCTRSNSVTLNVNDLPASNTGSDKSICTGSGVTIGAPTVAGNSYSWLPVTGLSSAIASDPTASPASTTIYTLTETIDATGCTKSNTVSVTVNPLPDAVTGPDQIICVGNSVVIGSTSVGGNSYSWSPSAGLSSDVVSDPTANPSATTIFTLTETITATGCTKSNSVTVSVTPAPASLTTTNINSTNALASWASVGGGYLYNFEKRAVGAASFDPGWTTVNTSWQMVNMIPNTQYEWHVRTICAPGQFSDWSTLETFTTSNILCTNMPTNLLANNITTTTAKLHWHAMNPVPDNYQVRYRIVGTSTWTNKTGLGTSKIRNITGLTPGSNYEWQIRGRCGSVAPFNYSVWSALSTFSTPTIRAALYDNEIEVAVFPNPTTGSITLTIPECDNCTYNLIMFDALGKIVYSSDLKIENNSVQLDFSNLSKGIYAMHVSDGELKKVLKIIIQ